MAFTTLYALVALAIAANAQTFTPLTDKHYAYPTGIPEQVDPVPGGRGPQSGFNICNSTTESQTSQCQTAFLNSIDDFCLWGPPQGIDSIADTEAAEVAWCTKKGKGARLIPAGTLTGIQFTKAPDYLQIIGHLDQTKIDITAGDPGGELDPNGADGRGNPLGGLLYSNGFPSNGGNNATFQQVISWTLFIGDNMFCFKACDPAGAHAADFCQHTLDRIGCAYNMPNNAQDGIFEVCESDDQDYPGVYTDAAGQTQSYAQPAETVAIGQLPYTPKIPASSNCVTFASSALYTDASTSSSAHSSTSTASKTASGSSATGSAASGSRSGSSAAPSKTASSDATALGISFISTLVGTAFAVTFLA